MTILRRLVYAGLLSAVAVCIALAIGTFGGGAASVISRLLGSAALGVSAAFVFRRLPGSRLVIPPVPPLKK